MKREIELNGQTYNVTDMSDAEIIQWARERRAIDAAMIQLRHKYRLPHLNALWSEIARGTMRTPARHHIGDCIARAGWGAVMGGNESIIGLEDLA